MYQLLPAEERACVLNRGSFPGDLKVYSGSLSMVTNTRRHISPTRGPPQVYYQSKSLPLAQT